MTPLSSNLKELSLAGLKNGEQGSDCDLSPQCSCKRLLIGGSMTVRVQESAQCGVSAKSASAQNG